MKLFLLAIVLQVFAINAFGQKPSCKSLHSGSFKMFTSESGATFIKRTEKQQTERNDLFGYEIIYDIRWVDECTYELRPKKLIKGHPSIMGDGTYVLTTVIMEISEKNYKVKTSSNFRPEVFNFVIEIID